MNVNLHEPRLNAVNQSSRLPTLNIPILALDQSEQTKLNPTVRIPSPATPKKNTDAQKTSMQFDIPVLAVPDLNDLRAVPFLA